MFRTVRLGLILALRARVTHTHDLPIRIRAEYLEMPGLRLSVHQAARLWNADAGQCSVALDDLVHNGFLYKKDAVYLLAHSGRRNA